MYLCVQDNVYKQIGQLLSMALVQGGGAATILCKSVYMYISGMNAADIIVKVEEVADHDIQELLVKVRKLLNMQNIAILCRVIIMLQYMFIQITVTHDNEVLKALLMDNIDLLTSCGFVKPVMRCNICDIPTIVQTIALHLVILNSKAELDQLSEGMSALEVLDAIKKTPNLLLPFFTRSGAIKLTAGTVALLYCCGYSLCQKEAGMPIHMYC